MPHDMNFYELRHSEPSSVGIQVERVLPLSPLFWERWCKSHSPAKVHVMTSAHWKKEGINSCRPNLGGLLGCDAKCLKIHLQRVLRPASALAEIDVCNLFAFTASGHPNPLIAFIMV